jgi:hypothetical protein
VTPVKAITHHHPLFLKEANKHPKIKLFNNDKSFSKGDRYITFNPNDLRFCVYTHTGNSPSLAGSFDTIVSAMFNARGKP